MLCLCNGDNYQCNIAVHAHICTNVLVHVGQCYKSFIEVWVIQNAGLFSTAINVKFINSQITVVSNQECAYISFKFNKGIF